MGNAIKRRVLLVQIDALRSDYLSAEDSPWLSSTASVTATGTVIPTFGFEPDGSFLAGAYPDEYDGGAHFWLDPERSQFSFLRNKALRAALKLLDKVTPFKLARRGCNYIMRRKLGDRGFNIQNLPLDTAHLFAPSESGSPFDVAFTGYRTIFHDCADAGLTTFSHHFPSFNTAFDIGLARLRADLGHNFNFAFWHIADLDVIGHKYGPNSQQRRDCLKRIDRELGCYVEELRAESAELDVIIFGDHGMVEVETEFDILEYLSGHGLESGRDFLCFIDSTMARFWDVRQPGELIEALSSIEVGRVLNQDDLNHFHLNYKHNKFGDVLFLIDAGVLITPNYFQGKSTNKGMHGYDTSHPHQQAAFVVISPNVFVPEGRIDGFDMRSIYGLLRYMLGLTEKLPTPFEAS